MFFVFVLFVFRYNLGLCGKFFKVEGSWFYEFYRFVFFRFFWEIVIIKLLWFFKLLFVYLEIDNSIGVYGVVMRVKCILWFG